MVPIGSIDYSGYINQNPESMKVMHQELSQGQQHQLAVLQEHRRDEKRDTVIETGEAEEAKIRDEDGGHGQSGHSQGKGKQEHEGEQNHYITVDDEKLGSHFDVSA